MQKSVQNKSPCSNCSEGVYLDNMFCSFCGSQQIFDFGGKEIKLIYPEVLTPVYIKKVKKLDEWDNRRGVWKNPIRTLKMSIKTGKPTDLSDLTADGKYSSFLQNVFLSIFMFFLPFILYLVISYYLRG